MWVGVRQRYSRFHDNIKVTPAQRDDGLAKQKGVRQSLQRAYYQTSTEQPPGLIVGSWGQRTQTRPTNDVDVFFTLPHSVYNRFNAYLGNKQSALLQDVKSKLLVTNPATAMRGDGQVVQVMFNTIAVEVVPVFQVGNGRQYVMADTNNGGSWKLVDPYAEQELVDYIDNLSSKNARKLAKMMKVWKRYCNVPLKSYQVVLLTMEFMRNYEYRNYDYYWYDWFVRDFFDFLCGVSFYSLTIPGTGEKVNLGDQWHSRAVAARDRAIKACEFEQADMIVSAGQEWQKIFGPQIPVNV